MKNNKQLWVAFKSGEEKAFSKLFHDYYFRLYHYGLKLVQEKELVKDVLQDFYLYLFESRESLADEVNNVTSYLLASFRRRLLREINNRRVEKTRQNEASPEDYLFVIGIEEIIIKKESKAQNKKTVVRLLSELPPRQREILYLKYYMDLTLPEIADTLSISYQVVANHLYRALKKLKGSNQAQSFAQSKF